MTIHILDMHNGYRPDMSIGYFRVDRGSPVGNPYVLKSEKHRDIVCDLYERHFNNTLLKTPQALNYLNRIIRWLRGHETVNLLCWCGERRCHAETIKRWLEANY